MLITINILKIVLDSSELVFTHLLDGVEPEVIDNVKNVTESVDGVCEVTDLRVRWIGHRLHAEINASVSPSIAVGEGHEIANAIREKLFENFSYFSGTTIHGILSQPQGSVATVGLRIKKYYMENKNMF